MNQPRMVLSELSANTFRRKVLKCVDLFCGGGGTSTGLLKACDELSVTVELTAINHWPVAIATHSTNYPSARHLCVSVDDVNPRSLFKEGELDVLWASPECTHHSRARGGKPINEQSRATAHCVTRWADALRPPVIMVENVAEFEEWGDTDGKGKRQKSKRGKTFMAWVRMLESFGYATSSIGRSRASPSLIERNLSSPKH